MDHYHHEKKKFTYIVFAIIVIVFGVVLWRLWKKRQEPHEGEIRVEIATVDGTKTDLEYSTTNMFPGETREYKLVVTAKETANYHLVFSLNTEHASRTAFARYVSVSVVLDDRERGKLTLQEGFDGAIISMTEWIEKSEKLELTVVYEMSIDATDAVQGEAVDFELNLEASGTTKRE